MLLIVIVCRDIEKFVSWRYMWYMWRSRHPFYNNDFSTLFYWILDIDDESSRNHGTLTLFDFILIINRHNSEDEFNK